MRYPCGQSGWVLHLLPYTNARRVRWLKPRDTEIMETRRECELLDSQRLGNRNNRINQRCNRSDAGTADDDAAFHRDVARPAIHVRGAYVGAVVVRNKNLGVKGFDHRRAQGWIMCDGIS